MSFTHTAIVKHSGGSSPIEKSKSIAAGYEQNVSEAIPDSTTDGLVAFTCDYSQLKMLTIYSDQDVLLEWNDGSGSQGSLSISAGVPFQWIYGSGITCPIGADITALYVTNASGSTANLEIRSLEDPTA